VRGSVAPTRDPSLYELWVSMRDGQVAETALAVIEKTLADVVAHGVLPSELDKAKNRLELGFLQGMETVSGKAEQIGFYETVLGDAAKIFEQLTAYRAVTGDEVTRVAKQLLVPTRRTTLFVRPSEDEETEEAA